MVAIVAFLLAGCGKKETCGDPVKVVQEFHDAIEAGMTEEAYGLLDAASRRALETAAAAASTKTGRELRPWEMLVPQRLVRAATVGKMQPVEEKGEARGVRVKLADGTEARAAVVKEGSCYKVKAGL